MDKEHMEYIEKLKYELRELSRGEFIWSDYATPAIAKRVARIASEALIIITDLTANKKAEHSS